jgi:hypothetical protein
MQQTTGGSLAASKVSPSRTRASSRLARSAVIDDEGVGLLVPINGSAGIWGPSSIACAQLAQAEINAAGGLLDRKLRLRVIDSSDEALEVGHVTGELMRGGAIDAIVGMHTSQVRQRVLRDVARQIPYVYTPLYEGGERTPGVFALGETPGQQLRPAIEYLMERYRARRWMFIGNDYVWPRVSHRLAARTATAAALLGDRYLPFGVEDHSSCSTHRRLRPDAILLSRSARRVNFVAPSAAAACRATCSLSRDRETGCWPSAPTTPTVCSSSGYFSSLDNDSNMAFKGATTTSASARRLNSLGQSTLRSVHFMAALARRAADEAPLIGPLATPLPFRSVRGTRYLGNDHCLQPTYLAEARGHFFQAPIAL